MADLLIAGTVAEGVIAGTVVEGVIAGGGLVAGGGLIARGGGIAVEGGIAGGGVFGLSMGMTIGVGAIAIVVVVRGIVWFIYKYLKGSPDPAQIPNDFVMPELPEHEDLSNFSSAITISSSDINELNEAYAC